MNEVSEKKIRASRVIIAVLVIITLLQTAALILQNKRQCLLEKQREQGISLAKDPAAVARSPGIFSEVYG